MNDDDKLQRRLDDKNYKKKIKMAGIGGEISISKN